MDFLDQSKPILLICEDSIKMNILNYLLDNKKIIDIKFMKKSELINRMFFKIDDKAIYYLMDKYNYKYDIANMNLKNILFSLDRYSGNEKLDKLYELKQELKQNGLLVYDNSFKEYLNNFVVVFYGYNYFTKLENKMIKEIKEITDIEIVNKQVDKKVDCVYEFYDIEEEVEFVAIKISELIGFGVDINNIKLVNAKDEYVDKIKFVFDFYNIPVNGINKRSIFSTEIVQDFLDSLSVSILDSINFIKSKYDNLEIIDQIIGVCNEYVGLDNLVVVKEILSNKFKNVYLKESVFDKAVSIVDIKDVMENDYVFLVGFNQNSVPIIKKDEDYISDNLCNLVDYNPSYEINKLECESVKKDISSINNLIISYKLKSGKNSYTASSLVSDMNLKIIHSDNSYEVIYSDSFTKLKLCKYLDDYNKYGIIANKAIFETLYSNLDVNDYLSYDNSFTGIDKDYFYNKINKKLVLSYSSMNAYNECAFKYYADKILKVNSFSESFFTLIGNLYHHVLQVGISRNIDVETEVNGYLNDCNVEFSEKEKFFFDKLVNELKFLLEYIIDTKDKIGLANYLLEDNIIVDKSHILKVLFKGYVDKLICDKDSNIGVIVDYKTGKADFDLRYALYGLNLQVPIYLYLVRHKFKDIKFSGFYLQKVLSDAILSCDKDLLEQKKDNLKLRGYSNKNISILKEFDSNYYNSSLVKGLKVKNDGEFYSSSKVITDGEIDSLISLVDKRIDEVVCSLENALFTINPKKVGNNYDSCSNCKFNDICYKKDSDIVVLDEVSDLSFLGGEENA